MWFEKDPSIIRASTLENKHFHTVLDFRYLDVIKPSKRKFSRDFMIERKRSFEIVGIDYHYDLFLDYNIFGDRYYNGRILDLKFEPWNEYDPNAIAVYLNGKLGYISRYDTEEVGNIMRYSKRYVAKFNNHGCPGDERVDIYSLQEFKDETVLSYQTDVILTAKSSSYGYIKFIKGNVGHTVTFSFDYEEEKIAIMTDMDSVLGYFSDKFIQNQYWKTPIAGFIEEAKYNDELETIEIKMRLLMEKSVINKNYLKSYEGLEKFFGSFYDTGTYSISLADLKKAVPRKTDKLSAYDPLVKYLKDYHAITLLIN